MRLQVKYLSMEDHEVIDAFIEHLRALGHPHLRVDQRPDKENRDSSDIDAIAGKFAIEHTSVDTLPNQRRDSDWFMRAAGGFEQEILIKPQFRLEITLEYNAIGTGQNWTEIRQSLKNWISNDAVNLSEGRHVLDDVPGVPFLLRVIKANDRHPGVFFARLEPKDDTLVHRIRKLLDRKATKLAKYQGRETTTVLLVENEDIALMNDSKLLEAVRDAYSDGLPLGVDEVWYVDTSIPSETKFQNFTPLLIRQSEM